MCAVLQVASQHLRIRIVNLTITQTAAAQREQSEAGIANLLIPTLTSAQWPVDHCEAPPAAAAVSHLLDQIDPMSTGPHPQSPSASAAPSALSLYSSSIYPDVN